MKRIHAVLFDLGNVLAHIDFDAFWRTLGFQTQDSIAPFAEGYQSWTRRYETGHISTAEYLAGMCGVFQHRFTEARIERAFADILLEPVQGMRDVAASLSHSYRTALVSNTNEIHYTLSLERYEVLQFLEKHYMSYRLHVMKPAKEFYAAIIADLACSPAEILFIDDLAANIEGARLAGMQGIQFENTEHLKNTLKAREILPY